MSDHYRVLIVGGGTGGITVAARLRNLPNPPSVGIIEPSDKHYYQPIWTLVGAGVFAKETFVRDEADYIPPGADWIRDKVTSFEPDNNSVKTEGGKTITYDYLVVAAGVKLDWNRIKGLEGNLGKNGICSNYSYDTVDFTWDTLKNFTGGNAVFSQPKPPFKCGGAPQKIMYLTEHYLSKHGIRDKSRVMIYLPGDRIFGVPRYANSLEKICASRNIEVHPHHHLVEVRADAKEAVFEHVTDQSTEAVKFDMLHVVPPQSTPDFIAKSSLVDAAGYVDVDQYNLQHKKYPNIFSLGDCSSLPTAKTGAAVRKEAPVLVANMLSHMEGKKLEAEYHGYTSCPLVTGYGKLILAEFDYVGPDESFPFDQSQERYSMYALKAYALPEMYWHGMLRGRA